MNDSLGKSAFSFWSTFNLDKIPQMQLNPKPKYINLSVVPIFHVFTKKNISFFFQGGVILVSHDERLINAICNELWVCSKGKVYRMEGGLKEYRELVEKEMII